MVAIRLFMVFAFLMVASGVAAGAFGDRHLEVSLGDFLGRLAQAAREHDMWLSLGGFHERVAGEERIANTHVVLDNGGERRAAYRKAHLFDFEQLRESDSTLPGDRVCMVETPAGVVGLATCYDVRFPLFARALRRRGATLLTYPSAFTKATGEAHWEVLMRARAIETQSFVVAAAQTGRHDEKRESFGDAMVVDPWGVVLARLAPGVLGVAFADLDLDRVAAVRTRMPLGEHERPELYADAA